MNHFRCSRYLWCLTVFMVGFPIFYLIFAAFIFDLSSKGIISVALSPLFYLASFFWIMTGVGIRQMKQWSWYTLGAAQFFVTYLNALNLANYSQSEYKVSAFVLTLLIQFYAYYSVMLEIRVPFLFPNIKWWESGIAGMHHVQVELFHAGSQTGVSVGQLLDVSQKGCFIKCPIDFEAFEKIKIRIVAYGQDVDVPGIVVWNAKSTVTHPKGIGVRFMELDRTKRRKIKIISKRFVREKEKRHAEVQIPA